MQKVVNLRGAAAGMVEGLSLDQIADQIATEISVIEKAEGDIMSHWVTIGRLLLQGKTLTADPGCEFKGPNADARFAAWKSDTGVSSKLEYTHGADEAAAIWAAIEPDQYAAMRTLHPKVRTVRGLHQKWKDSQRPEPKPDPQPEPRPEPQPEPTPRPEPEMDRKPKPDVTPKPSQPTPRKDAIMRAVMLSNGAGVTLSGLRDYLINEDLIESSADQNVIRQAVSTLLFDDELRIDGGVVRLKATLVEPGELNESGKEKLARAVAQYQKHLDAIFQTKVTEAVREWRDTYMVPKHMELLARAEMVMKNRKGFLTKKQYITLVKALHPDTAPTDDVRSEAMVILSEHKVLMMAEKEDPTLDEYGIPRTKEDLLARMAAEARAKAAARPPGKKRTAT
jgi:hypothetical protein